MSQNVSYLKLLHQNSLDLKKKFLNLSDQQIRIQAKEITDSYWLIKANRIDIHVKEEEQANQITPPAPIMQKKESNIIRQQQNLQSPEQRIFLTSKGPFRKTIRIPTIINENQLMTQRRNSRNPEKIIAEKDELLLIQNEIIQKQKLQLQESQVQNELLLEKIQHHETTSQIFYDDISDYYFMDQKVLIGQGGFGQVYRVKCKVPQFKDQYRAVKVLDKQQLFSQCDRESILNEIYALKQLDHPNIVQLYDIFENQYELFLVMEHCEDHIESNIAEDEARIIMRQVIDAIRYCHQLGIVHKDIKPNNIMLKQRGNIQSVKLIDFGLCQYETHQYFEDKSGTKSFISPEIICGKYTKLCDIWSFAISLYTIITDFNPFKSNKNMNEKSLTQYNIMKMKIPSYQLKQANLSEKVFDLIQKCLVEEKYRLNADEVLLHPFFNTKC